MSAEFQPKAPEQLSKPENGLEDLARQRLEELKQTTEQSPDHKSAQERANEARGIINESQKSAEEPQPAVIETTPRPSSTPLLNPVINYRHTLTSLQRHLKPTSRTFSRVIHQPAIEKTSEALENTIARPALLNGALWTAVVVGATFYLIARQYGYPLSGSEMLFALVAGALIGILGEILWRAFKHS